MATTTRQCEGCGLTLVRKRYPSGKLEYAGVFARRRTCGRSCANRLGPRPAPTPPATSLAADYRDALAQGLRPIRTGRRDMGGMMTATTQPMQALVHANEVRTGVADFRRETATLERYDAIVTVIDAIKSRYDDKVLGAAKVRHLLMAIPWIGEDKAHRLLITAQVSNYDKRLRDLTARQRNLLVDILTREGWKKPRRRSR
jgi:hypothetical protein